MTPRPLGLLPSTLLSSILGVLQEIRTQEADPTVLLLTFILNNEALGGGR